MKALVLPPGLPIVAAGVGLIVSRWHRRTGTGITAVAVVSLYLLSTPFVASRLLASLEGPPAANVPSPPPQAIVVLSADMMPQRLPCAASSPGALTLERLRIGALYYRRSTGLPVLVTGGSVSDEPCPLAVVMKRVLETEFTVPVRWVEDRSVDTLENARMSGAILRQAGIRSVALVTHAWHMRRAARAFVTAGFDVVAVPTPYTMPAPWEPSAFLPTARGLQNSYYAVHEGVGFFYYLWRDRSSS